MTKFGRLTQVEEERVPRGHLRPHSKRAGLKRAKLLGPPIATPERLTYRATKFSIIAHVREERLPKPSPSTPPSQGGCGFSVPQNFWDPVPTPQRPRNFWDVPHMRIQYDKQVTKW